MVYDNLLIGMVCHMLMWQEAVVCMYNDSHLEGSSPKAVIITVNTHHLIILPDISCCVLLGRWATPQRSVTLCVSGGGGLCVCVVDGLYVRLG